MGGLLSGLNNLLFGKPPTAPTPPDPQKTIEAQTQGNIATAKEANRLGMMNKTTPLGSVTYTADPNSPSEYSATETWSPEELAKYQAGNKIDMQSLDLAGKTLDAAGNVIGKPVDFGEGAATLSPVQLAEMQRVGAAPGAELVGNMGKLERVANAAKGATVGPAEAMGRAASAGAQEKIDMGMLPSYGKVSGAGQGIQGDLNYGSLGALPEASDATRQRVEQAMYERQQMYLDPQFKRKADALSARLENSGVPLGSPAHKNAMAEFADEEERAYKGARNDAITMGGAEQSRLINDALGIRRQGAGEIENSGAFHNAAQAGKFGQGVTQTTTNNAASEAALNARLAALGQRNAAGQADFENQFSVTEQQNKAKQAEFENNMAGAGFNNDVGTTDLANALSATGQRNAATGSEFDASVASVNQRNQARGNEYTQNMQGAQLNNQAAQQEIQNRFAQENLSMDQKKQIVTEVMLKHDIPLRDAAALLSGTAPMLPTFTSTNFNPANVANTNIAGITQAGYDNQMGIYNAQQAQRDNEMQAAYGIAGKAAGGYASKSDRRLKSAIVPRGTMSSGLPWYSYVIDGVREVGVMADEVRKLFPQAVSRHADGYDRVDYSLLH